MTHRHRGQAAEIEQQLRALARQIRNIASAPVQDLASLLHAAAERAETIADATVGRPDDPLTKPAAPARLPLTIGIKRAKDLSDLSMGTLYNMMNDGRLRSTRVGGRRLIYSSSLMHVLGLGDDDGRVISPGIGEDGTPKTNSGWRRRGQKATID